MNFDSFPTPKQENIPPEKNEKGQVSVTPEDLKDEHVQNWLARSQGEGLVNNNIEITPGAREYKRLLDEFEATYSLEKLYAIVDLSADPDRKHPLRDPAKKALSLISNFARDNHVGPHAELKAQWKKISNAVGMVNKGMVDHNR